MAKRNHVAIWRQMRKQTPSGLSQRQAAAMAENTVRQFLTPYDFSRESNTGWYPCAAPSANLSLFVA
jgi:hypothetical protein